MSTDQQATLDAYVRAGVEAGAEPSIGDEHRQRADSTADGRASDLAEIFQTLTGDETFVETQEEAPSHAPIEGDEEVPDLSEDGLDDAADSDLVMGGWI